MKHISELEKKMIESGAHCADSIADIHNANSLNAQVEMMFKYAKACEEKQFPPLDWLRKNYSNKQKQGVFVDATGTATDMSKVLVMGKSRVTVKATGYTITRVLVKHDSVVDIIVEDHAHVLIDRRENGKANIVSQSEKGKVIWLH